MRLAAVLCLALRKLLAKAGALLTLRRLKLKTQVLTRFRSSDKKDCFGSLFYLH
jgi:hypothetical protein